MARTARRPRLRRSARPRLVTPVFLMITLATFAYFVSVGALIPTLPLFVEGPLGGGSISVGLTVGAFSLAAVVLRPLTGRLGDRRGRRLLMIAGSGIVAVSVAGILLGESLAWLLFLRVLGGVGEAGFYVGAASSINDLAPDERRGEALSLFSLALYGGLALGPVLGETVLGDGRFTAAWLVASAAALVAMLLAMRVPETRPEGIEEDPGSDRIVHRAALLPGAVLAASVWGLAGFNTFIPLYAIELGMDGSRFVFVTFSCTVLLIRSLGARIPDRLGPRTTARSSLMSSTVGLALMGLGGAGSVLFTGTVLFGIGQALAFPALMTMAVSAAPRSERASVVGTFTAFFDIAFGLGALSLGVVADLFGYSGVFVASSLVAAGALAGLLANSQRSRSRSARVAAEDVGA